VLKLSGAPKPGASRRSPDGELEYATSYYGYSLSYGMGALPMSERLSAELISHADFLEQDLVEDRTAEERADWVKHQRLVDLIVEAIVSTREILRKEDLSVFNQVAEADPDLTESLLDTYYTMACLKDVPKAVRRTLRLAQLRASTTPSKQTNRYVQEAARSYIRDLPMASVAMSRAALEQALKEQLGRQSDGVYRTFSELRTEAKEKGVLNARTNRVARDLAIRCNELLHEKPLESDDQAFEVLVVTRSLLQDIFSSRRD
jgi:hypothetical protein